LGLEARTKEKINVRQPLSRLIMKNTISLNNDFINLIKDEVNVKEIVSDLSIDNEVTLDTNISEELKEEGNVREFIRSIQDLRKENGLTINDRAILFIDTDEKTKSFIIKNKIQISEATLLKDIEFKVLEGEFIKISDFDIKFKIQK